MYQKILNPLNGQWQSVNSKRGKKIIYNYLKALMTGGSFSGNLGQAAHHRVARRGFGPSGAGSGQTAYVPAGHTSAGKQRAICSHAAEYRHCDKWLQNHCDNFENFASRRDNPCAPKGQHPRQGQHPQQGQYPPQGQYPSSPGSYESLDRGRAYNQNLNQTHGRSTWSGRERPVSVNSSGHKRQF